MTTSTRSILSSRNAQHAVNSTTGLSHIVHSTKSSVLPQQQPLVCTSAISSVATTYTVKTQLPAPAVQPSTYTSTPASLHNGELLVILIVDDELTFYVFLRHCIAAEC